VTAQLPDLNLNFEYSDDGDVPSRWRKNEDGFTFKRDSVHVKAGAYSISLVESGEPNYGQIFHSIDNLGFERLTFSGFISSSVRNKAHLVVQLDGKNHYSLGSDKSGEFVHNEVTVDVKDSKTIILFCLAETEAVFDDLNLTIDGIAQGSAPGGLSVEQLNELSLTSIPLSISLDSIQSCILRDKTGLVGLGEGSHGSAEFRFVRYELSKRLITTNGFRTLFLEANYYDIEPINDFIQGRSASLDLFGMNYWIYRTEAFSAFLNWLRAYNMDQDHKVAIVGYDIMDYGNAVDILRAHPTTTNPTLKQLARAESALVDISDIQNGVKKPSNKALKIIQDLESSLASVHDPAYKKALFVLKQYCRIIASPNPALRETLMLETLNYLKYDSTGTIVLAHNTHISALKAHYQQEMLTLITCTAAGNYLAKDNHSVIRTFPLQPPAIGDLEYYLNQLFTGATTLPIKRSSEFKKLIASTYQRNIGSFKPHREFDIHADYHLNDYLVFFPKSTRTVLLNQ